METRPRACYWMVDALERDLIKLVLARAGYEPVQCTDRDDLLTKVHDLFPQLIVLDIVLPGENGLEIIRNIKTEKKGIIPAILLVSSLSFPDIITQSRQAGADEFVVKPIDADVLFKKVSGLAKKPLSTNP
jgi:DNA-binding response OmpR family regulator